MTIDRVLVANRGEIARRVFASCRRLGIGTVAVHSDADAELPFVAEADLAVRLPGDAPGDTYLRADLVLDAARRAGADAIHPGYGFLSENADFARAVVDAGLTWIGPSPESIEAMGSKVEAKKLMSVAGVPILEAPDTPTEADLPLLVKASAGGGGRGMRVVRELAALPGEISAAEAEAASAFGDGTVFVEPYVERGRHVEVQVVGAPDRVLVLGTRDCSLQRRHQKVVEEAPAPGLSDEVRSAMHEAARAAAAAVGYVGAGTVEFLYDPATERFFFLEMNTRLQVEHPVTEEVYDVDLVELQLAVAEGRPLPDLVEPTGHAIEVRLYAEDPAADYQPQSGRLVAFEVPDVDRCFDQLDGPGIRLDAGFGAGDRVGTHYDAMLAKVICWAPDRLQAARRLAGALRRARVHGLTTNLDQLLRVLVDDAFLTGEVSTALLAERDWTTPAVDPLAPVAATLALAEHDHARARVQRGIPVGWRNVVSQPQATRWTVPGSAEPIEVRWLGGRDGYVLDEAEVLTASPGGASLTVDGVTRSYDVQVVDDGVRPRTAYVDGPHGSVTLAEVPRFVDPAEAVAEGSLLAPMPGTVVSIAAESGASVAANSTLLVLEAMKMQHAIKAPADGVVSVEVVVGQQVSAGDVLAVVTGEQE